MIQFFEQLGNTIDRRFRDAHHDEARFPEIAATALAERPPSDHLDREAVSAWLFDAVAIPEQQDIGGRFGEPPLTLYQGAGFYIDILVWTRGSTDIHQHGFCGAFHMLAGTCLHGSYSFQADDRINARMELGEVRLVHLELLKKGAVRPILPGRQMIHSTYHLGRPSLSVVVRTHGGADGNPQFSYRRPNLAVEPLDRYQFASPYALFTRRLQYLRSLRYTKDPALQPLLHKLLGEANLFETYWVLQAFVTEKELPELIEVARRRHGERVDRLRPVWEELIRSSVISGKGHLLKRPEHRLLVALLQTAPGWPRMAEVLAREFPDRAPAALVMEWLKELSTLTEEGGKRFLEVELDDLWLDVFRRMLEGADVEAIVGAFKAEFSPEEVDEQRPVLEGFVKTVRESRLFGKLFTP